MKYLDQTGLGYLWTKIKAKLAEKQNTLTFDSTPTSGSTNPVTSGGVYTALASKAPVVTLADGTDLDTVTAAGLYYIGANGVNLPNSAINGYILVISNSANNRCKQLFMRHGTQNTNDFQTYVRQYNSSTWGNWVKVLTAGEAVQITEGGTGAVTQEQAIYDLMAYAPYITQYISTEDLNNLTHSGFYQVSGAAANEPNAAPHFVISLTNADGTRRTQFAWRSTGNTTMDSAYTIYMRKYVTNTWGEWRVVRTPGTALTIAEGGTGATTAASALTSLGAVAKSGDTMTGHLTISTGLYPSLSLLPSTDNTNGKKAVFEGGTNNTASMQAWNDSTGSNRRAFAIFSSLGQSDLSNAVKLRSIVNGTTTDYVMYHRMSKDLYYFAGDTFSTSTANVIPAILTGSQKSIYLTINTPKSLDSISTVSVTSFIGGARQPGGGYVGSGSAASPWASTDSFQWVGASGLTISAEKTSDFSVRITITSTTAFTAGNTTTALTNNMPINFMAKWTLAFS